MSTIRSAHHSFSTSPGVADTNNALGTRCQNSSNASGRLSSALGKRYPPATNPSLRLRSPPCMARSCGSMTCDSSATKSQPRFFLVLPDPAFESKLR